VQAYPKNVVDFVKYLCNTMIVQILIVILLYVDFEINKIEIQSASYAGQKMTLF